MTEKTFLLCLGAPKCGTTWLYHYLRSYDEVALGFKKEFHVFDAVYLPHCKYFINQVTSNQKSQRQPLMEKYVGEQSLIASFRNDHSLYFDYFQSLVEENGKCLTADISPSYLSLPPPVLDLINTEFAKRNIRVKVVLLMRDPIERIISSCRMTLRLSVFKGKRISKDIHPDTFLKKYSRDLHVYENTQYMRAITNINSVFPSSCVYNGFFETMFSPCEIRRISRFLGLAEKEGFGEITFNKSSGEELDVSHYVLAEIRMLYNEQYELCNATFPGARIPEIWKYYFHERTSDQLQDNTAHQQS